MLSVMNAHGKEMAIQEQPSTYISNMMLPAKVKATRHQPLGPDCVISTSDITDQDTLKKMHYYWHISRDNGCVECIIKKQKSQNSVSVTDPKCVVTKKYRRFEAYSCMLCRTNFVTIVQALLHLKAIHRPNNKICIQDKDVFDNLDKAMEVPPVPVPWHKKSSEIPKSQFELINQPPTYVIPPGALATSSANDVVAKFPSTNIPTSIHPTSKSDKNSSTYSPVISILSAITTKYHKQVKNLQFKKDCTEAHVLFSDDTTVIAEIPDFATKSTLLSEVSSSDDPNDSLLFYIEESKDSSNGSDPVENRAILRTNKPKYARSLLEQTVKDQTQMQENSQTSKSDPASNDQLVKSESPPLENGLDSTKLRPSKPLKKSVRFTLGAPESSDDETSVSSDTCVNSAQKQEVNLKEEKPKEFPAIKVSEVAGTDMKTSEDVAFDGLQMVIDKLITTASKGRVVPPTSPLPTNALSSALPQVGSSPALLTMTTPSSSSGGPSLSRVQSWSPSVGSIPFSVATMRRPYTARGFTYAEKIQFMKQQNDYDAEFVNKHISTSKNSKLEDKRSLSSEDVTKLHQRSGDGETAEGIAENESPKDGSNESQLSNAAMAAYSAIMSRNFLNNFFPSEYYGSGEWANAAMESLKSLQPMLRAQDEHSSSHPSNEALSPSPFSRRPPDIRRQARSSDSLSDDNAASSKSFSKSFPRKRCKSNNESTNYANDEGYPPTRKKPRQVHLSEELRPSDYLDTSPSPPPRAASHNFIPSANSRKPKTLPSISRDSLDVDKVSGRAHKVPISPLLSEAGQQSSFTPQEQIHRPSGLVDTGALRNPIISNLNNKNMMAKCSSDSALSSSATPEHHQSPVTSHISTRANLENQTKSTNSSIDDRSQSKDLILHAEDSLELIKNVSLTDFQKQHAVLARVKTDGKNSNDSSKLLTNMPDMFSNCIDTYVQIKFVKKVCVCKVCGFSVNVASDETSRDGQDPAAALEAHVMEHSLKELYATNYKAPKQW